MQPNWRLIVSVVLKFALVMMLVIAAVTNASQFQGKALAARMVAYPLGACIVAIVWFGLRLSGRGPATFPYRVDILVAMPFVIDTAGNWLDLFDKVTWWDDVMHFTQWFWLLLGLAPLLVSQREAAWRNVLMIAGVGALIAVFWELGEFYLFVKDSPTERATAYQDTIGDLVLGSLGATLAGCLEVALRRRNPVLVKGR